MKIKNIEASTLYEYNKGIRTQYKYTEAMFTNSLFYDFLIENGLTHGKSFTRDIICLEFNFGCRSYKEELAHIEKILKIAEEDENFEKAERIKEIRAFAEENKLKYEKISKENLRIKLYQEGINVEYKIMGKRGKIKEQTNIHYKMLYRSTGKAKKGSCMFIRDELYDKAKDFLYMGLEIPEHNAPLVELSAYIPLISSTIVNKIEIDPKNILILKDVDTFFKTKVASIEINDKHQCVCNIRDNYEVKSTAFDGQALIESSMCPSWANGCILLRHHFFKAEAFKTNIQLFFKDYYGEEYETAQVEDMFGNLHYAKDIQMITTNNACKWLKFDVSYDYWCNKVNENGNMFGIVKTAHKSKLGDVQRMSYQMVNALDMDIMPQVVQVSKDYIESLKRDNDVFLDYLRMNKTFSNDYEVLVALVEQNREFLRSKYFRERKGIIIQQYTRNFKRGKLLQNADNLVIVGSPYAMLLHSINEDIFKDNTLVKEDSCYQCFTERFKNDEYLAEFRSPFNGKNNLGYMHNIYSDKMFKYFDLGSNVIAVNSIETDFQARNSGSDNDGDMIYTTNQLEIVNCAKEYQKQYLTIENNIPQEKILYDNTLLNYAKIDNELAGSGLYIGQSSNLAQLALTYSYNYNDINYNDYICILNALSQCAIDNAKRKFNINLKSEIKRIKKELGVKDKKLPLFWADVNKGTAKRRLSNKLICPMNYLREVKFRTYINSDSILTMDYFFINYKLDIGRYKGKKIEDLIKKYGIALCSYNIDNKNYDKHQSIPLGFDELIEDISKISISKTNIGLMSWLIDRCFIISDFMRRKQNLEFHTENMNKALLLKVLYVINPTSLLKIFSKGI